VIKISKNNDYVSLLTFCAIKR